MWGPGARRRFSASRRLIWAASGRSLASFVDKVPDGKCWIHEIRFDGYRVQLHIQDGATKVSTRRGNGKVDYGFDKHSAAELRKRLTPLIRKTQPYTKKIAYSGIWGEPTLLAEIEYRAKSAEGKVRHPFFPGLREDICGAGSQNESSFSQFAVILGRASSTSGLPLRTVPLARDERLTLITCGQLLQHVKERDDCSCP